MFTRTINRRFQSQLLPKFQQNNKKGLFEDAWVSKLTNRSVISVRGRDSTSILQNVATTDMRMMDDQERAALYTGFLTVKGKLMYDAIIARPLLASQTAEDMEYWVDVSDLDAEAFQKHLKRYAMRKNVQIEDISHVIKSFSIQTLAGLAEAEPEGHFFKEL